MEKMGLLWDEMEKVEEGGVGVDEIGRSDMRDRADGGVEEECVVVNGVGK